MLPDFDIRKKNKFLHEYIDSPPVIFSLETTSECNRKCNYCPQSVMNREKKTIDDDLFKNVILQLKDWGFQGQFTFGFLSEPLLDNRIESFSEFIKQHLPKVHIHFPTNGDFLTAKRASSLLLSGVDSIRITQHGDSLRYENELSELIKDKYEGKITVLREVGEPLKWGGYVEGADRIMNYPVCTWHKKMLIDCYGNYVRCCSDADGTYYYGNIKESKLNELWTLSKPFRKKLLTGKHYKDPFCRQCIGKLKFTNRLKINIRTKMRNTLGI